MRAFRFLSIGLGMAGLAGLAGAAESKPEVAFVIKTVPSQMKYDTADLVVAPGQKVKITLKNQDQLPHNLVVLREKNIFLPFSQKAWEMGEKGMEKGWVPDDPRVLAAIPMVDPGKEAAVSFTAPEREGDVDFVCTFPGHAMIMHGTLHVTTAPPPGLSNLTYQLYKGSWQKLPDFVSLPPENRVRTDEINNNLIDIGVAGMKDGFGLLFDATLNVPNDGTYRFFLSSDDGSALWIDDQPVVTNDGIHPHQEKIGRWQMTKGPHRLRLAYFEQAGEESLALSWDGPGVKMQSLGKDNRRGGESEPDIVLAPEGGRPVIYRGFMDKSGGSRRIVSVGYPNGLNLGFDQDQLRLALLWKGEFLNAGKHWSGRGGGGIGPAGYAIAEFAPGEQTAALPEPNAPWPALDEMNRATHGRFKGYTLDSAGNPTFRYTSADGVVEITDQPQPTGDMAANSESLVRKVSFKATGAGASTVFFRLSDRQNIEPGKDGGFKLGPNVTVSIEGGGSPVVRGQDLLVPVPLSGGSAQLTVTYRWF